MLIDSLHLGRRLLYLRLWRARCKLSDDHDSTQQQQQQKSTFRQLTRMLTTPQLDALARTVERRDDGSCVAVSEATVRSYCSDEAALVDLCCRLWRPCWTTTQQNDRDVDDDVCLDTDVVKLRRLPTCQCRAGADLCLNPYHWSRDVTPTTTSLDQHFNVEAAVRRGTVGADGDGAFMTSSTGAWCHITYHQYREHVGGAGSSLPVHEDSVHVFAGLHHGSQGLCLSAVRPSDTNALANVAASRGRSCGDGHAAAGVVERTLSKVGRGVSLFVERSTRSVWAYNRSERASVFVSLPTITPGLVLKLRPGQSARVHQWPAARHYQELVDEDGKKTGLDEQTASLSASHEQPDCLLISFVKGWGSARYKRRSILSCPCWLQVTLARTPPHDTLS